MSRTRTSQTAITQRWIGSVGQNLSGEHSVPSKTPSSASLSTAGRCDPAFSMSTDPSSVAVTGPDPTTIKTAAIPIAVKKTAVKRSAIGCLAVRQRLIYIHYLSCPHYNPTPGTGSADGYPNAPDRTRVWRVVWCFPWSGDMCGKGVSTTFGGLGPF